MHPISLRDNCVKPTSGLPKTAADRREKLSKAPPVLRTLRHHEGTFVFIRKPSGRLSRPSLNLNLPKFARAAAPRPQSLASLKERQTSLAAGKLALAIDKT
ncbi:hypothetical protein C0Q70_03956 [Pomacea canaliculata]|uniref:Uncharacterized protein n=1 Tax=Pomacea canaliculata TaxID=400727 RepID=A0A2T7PU57_POMCA|nr:hypothetical protein C0Q70_03956 [Pomacea canaliculata]